jgi:hypothetical protein
MSVPGRYSGTPERGVTVTGGISVVLMGAGFFILREIVQMSSMLGRIQGPKIVTVRYVHIP